MTSPHLRLLVLSAFFITACHDLTIPPAPPPPGPGLIAGRLVWNRPGRLLREPAAGGRVFLLGTNLAVQADDDGRFLLNGLTSNEGHCLTSATYAASCSAPKPSTASGARSSTKARSVSAPRLLAYSINVLVALSPAGRGSSRWAPSGRGCLV